MSINEATPIDNLVEEYLRLRDEEDRVRNRMEKELSDIRVEKGKIEIQLQQQIQDLRVESLRTKLGTVFVTTKASVRVADKQVLKDFVEGSGEWSLLDIKANRNAVAEYLEQHNELPPGIDYRQYQEVNVRRR